MKIKSKLLLGIGLLFLLNLVVGVTATIYFQQLSNNSKSILSANFKSLQYSRQLEELVQNSKGLTATEIIAFEKYLQMQEKNISEAGEADLTGELRHTFNKIKNTSGRALEHSSIEEIQQIINKIENLNLNAIQAKNVRAQELARSVSFTVGMLTAFCLLIGFSFMVNFPGYIANPLQELLSGIKAISNKQYDRQLKIQTNDELGELATAFNAMALKLKEYESSNMVEILSEKRRIEAIIDSMNDAVVGLDQEDNILFVNTLSSELLKLDKATQIGSYAPDVALRNDLFRDVLTIADNKEIAFKSFAGDRFFTKETISIKHKEEEIGKVIILKNITPFHELDAAKTNFIATISHELKTPISSIKLSLKLLEDERIGPVNHEQITLIQNIKDDANRLLRITGELLDLSQVESGNINLNIKEASPVSIIEYATNTVYSQAAQKNIAIDVKCAEMIPNIAADEEKTAWVLVNFLSNALRYTTVGGRIELSVYQRNDSVEFIVRDTGPGIEMKYQERIFDKYFQVPSTENKKTGTGLGLAISKDFIEAQKGQIFLHSKIGEGSTFGFTIPISKTLQLT